MIFNQSITQRFDKNTACPEIINIEKNAIVHLVFIDVSTPNLQVHLNGAGGECHMYYVHQFDEHSHQCHVHFIHHAPHTSSRIIARMVVDGQGKGSLIATSTINPDCDNAETAQDLKGLVLHHNAQIFGKPELFIHHDKVKAAHGCAIGGLDENQLFYLYTRGINPQTARQLLCDSFIGEIIQEIEKL